MTGMFQSSRTASGSSRLQASSAFSPSSASTIWKTQTFQDAPCDLADDGRIVDHQACSHFSFFPMRRFDGISGYPGRRRLRHQRRFGNALCNR